MMFGCFMKLRHLSRVVMPPGLGSWLCGAALCVVFAGTLRADEFDDLRLRWRDMLTGGTNLDLGDAVVQSRLNSIANTANYNWSTLDTSPSRTYLWADAARTNQSEDISSCYSRLRAMALAWATRGCTLETNATLGADIVSGLNWLYANRYNETKSEYDNWWDWEIGSPQNLNNAAVLIYDLLTPAQITNYNKAVDKFVPATSKTGANRTDTALVVAIRGILGRNAAKLINARDGLSPVFPYVTSSDGFYTDGSFIQHGKHPYTGSYGSVLIDGLSKLMWLLSDSTWQVVDPAQANVSRWVYDSYEPIIYKGATMDNLRGRSISRIGTSDHSAGAGNMSSILQIALFAPTNDAAAFKSMLKFWILADTSRNFTNNVALGLMPQTRHLMADTNIIPRGELIGHYQFHNMDRVVHLRPGFGFAVSMSSSRIYAFETINNENLHGWFTGDGLTALYNDDLGQFSGNYWATVDPYHLPGTTVDLTPRVDGAGNNYLSSQNWVGGAGLGDFGVSGMSLAAQASSLVAKKSWFMFDNEIVCLGAGITCGGANAVHTTVENRKLGSAATNQFIVDGLTKTTSLGWSTSFNGASWCWLAGAGGYYFPGGADFSAVRGSRTNSWYAINKPSVVTQSLTNPVVDPYLTFWFDHGVKPTNSTYAYAILPNLSPVQVNAYVGAPDIVVLTNTTTVQAVRENTLGLVAANFWVDSPNGADLITVNKKAAVITRETNNLIEVAVADPTQANTGSIVVTLDRAATWLVSADAGVTVQQLTPQIRFSVAVNGAKGRSFRATFSTDSANPNPTWDANLAATGAQDGSGVWNGVSPNWWNGVTNVPWNDAAAPIVTFGNGGPAGTVSISGAHTLQSLAFNAVSNGSYTLTGAQPLTLASGIMASTGATLAVPLDLVGDQIWTVTASNTLAFSASISASVPVVLSLAGTGKFRFTGGSNQLPANLAWLNLGGNVTLNLENSAQTISQLTIDDNVTAAVAGAGSLTLSSPSDRRLGGKASGTSQTLDLSGLASFTSTAPANTFSVGGQTSTVAGTGTLQLATNNLITAQTFGVQNVTGSTSAQSSGTLSLGRSTTINADSGVVGLVRDNGTIRYLSGTMNPTLMIRGADGVSPALEWKLGSRGSSYFTSNTALVDLVSGVSGVSTLDAKIGTIKIADEGYNLSTTASLNGTFIMGGGLLDATNILLGLKSSVTTQALGIVNATFVQTNGGTVRAYALTLGDRISGNTGTINTTYHLGGGATLRAQFVQAGAGTANRVVNWVDGTIRNYDAGTDLLIGTNIQMTLAATGMHYLAVDAGRSGVVAASLTGLGGLTKTGAGSATLAGVNSYNATTTVSEGTVLVGGTLGGAGTVTVAAGAVLGGSGLIRAPVVVNAAGTLSPGASIGTLTISNNLFLKGNLLMELNKSLPTSNDFVIVSGTLTNLGVGTLTAVNLGTNALVPGDRFQLFNQPVLNGGAMTLSSGGGVIWSNQLAVDGSIEVVGTVNLMPTNLLASAIGNALELSWPADHTGWRLETQTNVLSAGLGTNWVAWPGSESKHTVTIPLGLTNPAVFFRLVYP